MKAKGFWSTAIWTAVATSLAAQAPAPGGSAAGQPQAVQAAPPSSQTPPTFRVQVDAVTQDVIVRDDRGQFLPDLTKDEFEVFEDGVKQDIVSMTMIHGGRVTNLLEAPPPPPPEGVILPPVRRVNDSSGRIFLFFIDDLHLRFQNTGRVRELFKKMQKGLVHEGDLFGLVSSGPSSISVDMTYDIKRLEQAISKITGDGLKPSEIIQSGSGAQGPTEVRHRVRVAFSTMEEALENLEKVHNRRKALVWVSEGYDFNPFQNSRLGVMDPNSPFLQNRSQQTVNVNNCQQAQESGVSGGCDPSRDPTVMAAKQNEQFADADLFRDMNEITRAANRANVTIYTIDPRGLVAGSDIDEQVDPQDWNRYIRKSQDTMRVLADETGGVAVVNQNDFDKAIRRIDNETSDYYVLGYYSNNPDPTKRRRQVDIRLTRKNANIVAARKEYVLKTPGVGVSKP